MALQTAANILDRHQIESTATIINTEATTPPMIPACWPRVSLFTDCAFAEAWGVVETAGGGERAEEGNVEKVVREKVRFPPGEYICQCYCWYRLSFKDCCTC